MLYKKVDQTVIDELIKQGILVPGEFIATDHYIAVPSKYGKKLYNYMYKNGYGSIAQNEYYCDKEEIHIQYINRNI